MSVSLGANLRKRLVEACEEDEISLSQTAKEAIRRWLSSRERKIQRDRKAAKD